MKTPDATPTAATLRFAPPYSQRSSSLLSFSGPWKSKQSVIFKNAAQSRRGEMSKKKKKKQKERDQCGCELCKSPKSTRCTDLVTLTHARKNTWRSLFVALAPSPLLLRQMECNSEKSMSETLVGGRVQRAQMGVRWDVSFQEIGIGWREGVGWWVRKWRGVVFWAMLYN